MIRSGRKDQDREGERERERGREREGGRERERGREGKEGRCVINLSFLDPFCYRRGGV